MSKLEYAMSVTGFESESLDIELLVGAFAMIKRWSYEEPSVKARGKISFLDTFRNAGRAILAESADKMDEHNTPKNKILLTFVRSALPASRTPIINSPGS